MLIPQVAFAGESEEKKKGGGQDYIQITTLTGTLTRPNGQHGVLTVECGVDVHDRNLHKLAETSRKWITRVPATLTEAQEVLAQAQPETMASLPNG